MERERYLLSKIPGPKGLSYYRTLGGIGSDFFQTSTALFKQFGKIVAVAPTFGPHMRLVSTSPSCLGAIYAYGPEINHEIAAESNVFHKHPLLGGVHPVKTHTDRRRKLSLWGTGLFNMNDDEHRQGRRLLMPAFHKNRLESYHSQIVAATQEMLDSWRVGDVRNLHRDMIELTGQIVVTTLFGQSRELSVRSAADMLHKFMLTMFTPGTRFFPVDIPGTTYHSLLDQVEAIDRILRALIAEKRQHLEGANDILAMLIEARREDGTPLSEDELIEHATVIYTAGHQTSSDALCWTILLLSQHPGVAASLVEELDSVLKGEAPTLEQFNDLPLLDRVVKESLRLLPPAPINGRVLSRDTELCGYTVPKDTEVLFSILHTHHMDEIYTAPKRFEPARWETINPTAYEYAPFSAGPRMCMGAPFAWMEMKIILAMLLQRYKLEIPAGTSINPIMTVTLGPDALPVSVSSRNKDYHITIGGIGGKIRHLIDLPS